jgi:hypothetical protein
VLRDRDAHEARADDIRVLRMDAADDKTERCAARAIRENRSVIRRFGVPGNALAGFSNRF